MPYSWGRPPAPVDKTKQGGKNNDASKMTDFRKIETIVAVNASKVGLKNRNLLTDFDERNRASVLSNTLYRIPRFG